MKKKIFAIALAVMLFALAIAGSSVAYFTDVEAVTNTFTAGKVDITLTYESTTANAADRATVITLAAKDHVYPGQIFPVHATIENVGGANDEIAYVGSIITIKNDEDFSSIMGVTGGTDNIPVAVKDFLSGLVADGSDYKVSMKVSADKKEITVYVIKTAALTIGDSCVIFDDIKVPTEWDNEQMAVFSGLSVSVTAYATQVPGFANAEEAITTAFATAWANYN